MKDLKINVKIILGFSCVLAFLLIVAGTAIISSTNTGNNIDSVEAHGELQEYANNLMHIINETRINAGVLYNTHSPSAYSDVVKQLMYSDVRLNKLNTFLSDKPQFNEFKNSIDSFTPLYNEWSNGIRSIGTIYNLEESFTEEQAESYSELSVGLKRTGLLAHEVLSNAILDVEFDSMNSIKDTNLFNTVAILIVSVISFLAFLTAVILMLKIVRSITEPIRCMNEVLGVIGQTGDLQISSSLGVRLNSIASGKDEMASCMSALLVLINHLHEIDKTLSQVADGNLTTDIALLSKQDTMGYAVKKMISDLNEKFETIAQCTNNVNDKAVQLSDSSNQMANGSVAQTNSINGLLTVLHDVGQKVEHNTDLARQSSGLVSNIQQNANIGTEKMNQMIQAAADINAASQSINKVIKVIDDIAFQTNILALNASVEAARAGVHGKGFAVVAEEVRKLATKSADAAKDTGVLIENTIQKAELGTTIAQDTSLSLKEIVSGVEKNNDIIQEITQLSSEQTSSINGVINEAEQVSGIAERNNSIALESSAAVEDISKQSDLLKDLVSQFKLSKVQEGF